MKSIRVNNGVTSAGFAQGVRIAVYEGTGAGAKAYNLSNGDLLPEQQIKAGDGPVSVRFSAAYVSDNPATITAGIANASLPFTLTYE